MPSKAAMQAHAAAQLRESTKVVANGPSKDELIKAGAEFARKKVGENLGRYDLIKDDNLDDVPQFAMSELRLGRVLGRGGFGVVNEILGIDVKDSAADDGPEMDDEGGDESRAFIAKHCIRDGGDARYAIKYLSDVIKNDPTQFIQGIIDMSIETNFLAAIEHPNIIKMRAYATGDAFDPGYFIVLDRLYDTLEARLPKWAKKQRRSSSFIGRKVLDKKGTKRDKLLEERLAYAFDLSAALEYLHGMKVIYRDLKPENIGFDVRDDIKLFDFGLAKQLDEADKNEDGTYKLTGDTGSLRYMAPEICLEKPYNFTVDTFSFSILLWEMMSLSKPFEGYTPNMHRERVVGKGVRPKIDMSWPNSIRSIMQRGWSDNISVRPPMDSVTSILKKEVTRLRDGDDSQLQHYQRRSTFVLRPKKK